MENPNKHRAANLGITTILSGQPRKVVTHSTLDTRYSG
jgi:hypothetical protein